MQVTIEPISSVEKKVAVEIPWPYVARKLDDKYREIGRSVALRGFRKGKVPRPILEQMYAQSVERELVQELVQESFIAAANQYALQPVSEPVVENIHLRPGQPFGYTARVEVRAEVEPKDYEGVEVETKEPTVSDAEVDLAVERKRQELTEYKEISERTTLSDQDIVMIQLNGTVGDQPISNNGMVVDLGDAARSPIPGLRDALLGAPIDAKDHTLEFTVAPPTAQPAGEELEPDSPEAIAQKNAPLTGKTAKITIHVQYARQKHTPTLDDEFAKDTGEGDTVDELKGKLREKLLVQATDRNKSQVRLELVKEIVRRNDFEVPPNLVERHLDSLVSRARMFMQMRGIDKDGFAAIEPRVRDDLRGTAIHDVRATFLLEAIADKEKIETTDAEVEKKLAELAQSRETSVPRLKAELQKEGRLGLLRHQIREEKTVDLLLGRAKLSGPLASAFASK